MEPLAELIGESPAVQAIRDQIRRLVARGQAGRRLPSILITGETGTGKGLAARTIHRAGPRAGGPFVDVNCAAIPETLVEAELFGYERGAFTDARRSKPGLFQTAHRGTIFLDEVGLLPASMQAKLLKVLEDQAVRRLGSNVSEPVDTAIISATNADLAAAAAEGHFREDLYHRLAVLTLELPPLRERGQDIALLANRFLARACAEYGMAPKRLTTAAEACLGQYAWPGNVRELSNVMERVALLVEGEEVGEDLLEIHPAPARASVSLPAVPTPRPAAVSLEDAMRDHLLAALEQSDWNLSRTAARLGISRNTVRARIDRFGLAPKASSRSAPRRPPRASPASAPSPALREEPARQAAVLGTVRWDHRRVGFLRVILIEASTGRALRESNRALDMLIQKVESFGGRVIEIGVTGIIAAFGLEPVEDSLRRAALAAMAMQKAARRAEDTGIEGPAMKAAIHAASVPIARVGNAADIDADAKRPIWSTLAGLLEMAEPGAIMVSQPAVSLLAWQFALEETGASHADSGPVSKLTAYRSMPFDLGGQAGRFVGRADELALFRSRLATAEAGQGQIIAFVGEAGIGKSRLLFELRRSLAEEAVVYLEGHCLSYGSAIPYLPILDLLRSLCQIEERDAPGVVAEKIRRNLERLGMDAVAAAPYLLHLLGVKDDEGQTSALAPELIKLRTFETLRTLFVRSSQQQPLILAIEDLHWIDRTSEEFLGALADRIVGAPILLVATYRPEYTPPWLERSSSTQIGLQPLAPHDSLAVVQGIFGQDDLSDSLAGLLLGKAEGNPFFLEELARSARELRGTAATLTVPDRVQEVLGARIDRLLPHERDLLQTAAVIGKDFSLEILRTIAGKPDEALRESLQHLRAGDFIYETNLVPQPEYTFKHALTHEVAYGSLPAEQRSALHARILAELEPLHRDRLDHLQRLADHAVRGAVWDKALQYLRQAGAKAYAAGAHREAVRSFEQALDTLGHLPTSREQCEAAIDLRFDLRTSLLPLGEVERGLAYVHEAEALTLDLGDQRRAAQIAIYLTGQLYLMGDYDRAWEAGQRALSVGHVLDDFGLRISTNAYLGQVLLARGEYRGAGGFFRENVEALVGPRARERFGLPQLPSVHSRMCLAWSLAELGEFDAALTQAREAVEIAEAVDQPLSRTVAYAGLGITALHRGEHARAIGALEQALALIRDWNIPLWFPRVASSLGAAYALGGRTAEGLPLLERAVERAKTMRLVGGLALLVGYHADAFRLAGGLDEASVLAARATMLAREHRERGYEAMALRVAGEVALACDDLANAGTALGEAATLAEVLGMEPLLGHCRLGLGLVALRQGKEDEARRLLTAARAGYAAMGMAAWVSRADAALAAAG